MQTLIQCKSEENLYQARTLEIESPKNTSYRISAMDLMGLSWIFKEDDEI